MLRFQSTEKNNSKNIINSGWFILAAVLITFSLRLYDISNRPLHNDEAVNSVKLKYLLEEGEFKYDPIEYHGPTLYYFSLASAWLFGENQYKNLDEVIIRIVPVVFSLLLFFILYLLRDSISRISLLIITIFLIISPYINFYSRYFIHEALFASLSFLFISAFYKFNQTSNNYWIVLSGVFAGLVFATKETSLIVFFSFFVAVIATKTYKCLKVKNIVLFIISFFLISIIFYSSFFTNMQGIVDSILTYKNYFVKSSSINEHLQPWYYYLELISFSKIGSYLISEAVILVLGILGMVFSFRKISKKSNNTFFRLVAIFTIISFAIFSIIPYKTPWNMFSCWIGIIFLSGFGFETIYKLAKNKTVRIILILFMIFASVHLIFQLYLTSYKFHSSPKNPFTYSQPTSEIYSLTDEVENLIEYNEDILINIVAEENHYWPLPWYFRKAKNIAWNNAPAEDIYKFDIIISQPKFLDDIINKLYTIPPPGEKNLYIPLLQNETQIRPGLFFLVYIKNDVYQNYINTINNK